jgi:PAS domain S-box-containing protein
MGSVPIQADGRAIACLNVSCKRFRAFSSEVRFALETIAAQFGQAISRIRRAEALKASEPRYSMLFQTAHDAAFIHGFNPDGTPGAIVECNAAAEQLFGRSREVLLLTPLLELADPEERNMFRQQAMRFVEDREVTFDGTIRRLDGNRLRSGRTHAEAFWRGGQGGW